MRTMKLVRTVHLIAQYVAGRQEHGERLDGSSEGQHVLDSLPDKWRLLLRGQPMAGPGRTTSFRGRSENSFEGKSLKKGPVNHLASVGSVYISLNPYAWNLGVGNV